MQDQVNATRAPLKRVPWNKGKVTGAKPPLRPKHVWSIRTKFQIEGRSRDLAMFNLAIDSKLRGCDVVAIRVEDVAASLAVDFVLPKRALVLSETKIAKPSPDIHAGLLRSNNLRPSRFLRTARFGQSVKTLSSIPVLAGQQHPAP